jgi:hypothetical protein
MTELCEQGDKHDSIGGQKSFDISWKTNNVWKKVL